MGIGTYHFGERRRRDLSGNIWFCCLIRTFLSAVVPDPLFPLARPPLSVSPAPRTCHPANINPHPKDSKRLAISLTHTLRNPHIVVKQFISDVLKAMCPSKVVARGVYETPIMFRCIPPYNLEKKDL